jgi:radical SAM superfamily enzyme YgiQ (UPF0313 family)
MRVLLVNAPNSGRYTAQEKYGLPPTTQIFRGEPLALEVLAASLDGHEVEILDLKAQPEPLVPVLDRLRPDVVGFTAMTCEVNAVRKLCAETRAWNPAVTTVVGGIHASADPEAFNRPDVDYVAVGLGHESLPELVTRLEIGERRPDIGGIGRRVADGPIRVRRRGPPANPDPSPRHDLVARYADRYVIPSLKTAMAYVVTAYGCPYDCSFCCVGRLTDGRYLPRPVEDVLSDVQALGAAPLVRFVDANTFGDVRGAEKLRKALESAGFHRHLVLDVRVDTVVSHAALLREWKRIGLRAAVVGFEEIDDRRLAEWEKRTRADQAEQAIEILKSLGVSIIGDFIVSPDYGPADFDRLEAFILRNRIDLPVVAVLTPLPGTRLHASMKDQIVVHDLDYYTLGNAVTRTALPEKEFYERLTALQLRVTAKAAI